MLLTPQRGPTPLPLWGKGSFLTNIEVFGFIFVIFTQKCIASDICDAAFCVVNLSVSIISRRGSFFHFPPAGSANKRVGKVCLDFPTQFYYRVFFTLTEKCIANDICDAGGAHFFTFPPAGSANKRVGKVCLTFLPK